MLKELLVRLVLCCLIFLVLLKALYASKFQLSGEDELFLDKLERASVLFFWEQADPETGQIRDRAVVTGEDETRPGLLFTNKCILINLNQY